MAACKWMEANHKLTSYLLFTHTERQGVWNQDRGGNNTGFNIEHFRDFNNAAPDVCFGFETMPGHQADLSGGATVRAAFGGGTLRRHRVLRRHHRPHLGRHVERRPQLVAVRQLRLSLPERARICRHRWAPMRPPIPIPTTAVQDPNTINSGWRGALATHADFWPGEFQKDYVS